MRKESGSGAWPLRGEFETLVMVKMVDMVSGRLPAERVELWRIPLQRYREPVARLEALLSPEEKRRAKRFHFDTDRSRYTVTRGALRIILSQYLDVNPHDLRFQTGRFGKPHLVSPHAASRKGPTEVSTGLLSENRASFRPELHFNLSHCEDLAVVAVSKKRLVGVDVEKVRNIGDLNRVVYRYFSQEEKHFLQSVSNSEYTAALLTLWSRREAAAKAFGLNLSAALSTMKIPPYSRGGGADLLNFAHLETDTGIKRPVWSIRDVELDNGHVGALCAEGPEVPVVSRDFTFESA